MSNSVRIDLVEQLHRLYTQPDIISSCQTPSSSLSSCDYVKVVN